MSEIRINAQDFSLLLQEVQHLRAQRDELQSANTRLVLENRDLKEAIRTASCRNVEVVLGWCDGATR